MKRQMSEKKKKEKININRHFMRTYNVLTTQEKEVESLETDVSETNSHVTVMPCLM